MQLNKFNCLILYGDDTLSLNQFLDSSIQSILEKNPLLEMLSLEELNEEVLSQTIESPSIFGNNYLIKTKKVKSTISLETLIKDIDNNILIIVAYTDKNPYPRLEKKENIFIKNFNLPKIYEIEKIVLNTFKDKIDHNLAPYIAGSIKSLTEINEIQVKMDFLKITKLNFQNISLLIDNYSSNVFSLIEIFFNPKAKIFITSIHKYLENPDSLNSFLSNLYKRVQILVTIKELSLNNYSLQDIAKKIQKHIFLVKIMSNTIHSWSLKKIQNLLLNILLTEFDIRYYNINNANYFIEKLYFIAHYKI